MIRHAPPRQEPMVTAPATRRNGYRAEVDRPPSGLPEPCPGRCGTSHVGLVLDELRTEYGLTYEEIAAELDLKPTSVSAMLGKHRTGLLLDTPPPNPIESPEPAPARPERTPARPLTDRQTQRITDLWADGYEPSEIATRVKIPTASVAAALREAGLS